MTQKIGKYEIRARVGRGGMGMVFVAHDPALDRSTPTSSRSTRWGRTTGARYIVMEFLEGDELRRVISAVVAGNIERRWIRAGRRAGAP